MIGAVTFDLWNTLVSEGEGGLLRPRAEAWQRILKGAGIEVPLDRLEAAHGAALDAYKAAWERGDQFRSAEATRCALADLDLAVGAADAERLEHAFHEAGLASTLEVVPGATHVLDELRADGVRTAIICDIGLTPSSALTHHLDGAGILGRIDVQAWSDRLGIYKPDPSIFDWTLRELGVAADRAVHVGDRLRTDVAGARSAGLATVRYTGIYDDPAPLPEADHVVHELAAALPWLTGRGGPRR